MKSNLKEKFDKELDKILKDKKTLYDKYGDKCPYCGFKVPEHYQERNKPTSLSTHMGKMHKEKLVNKGMRIKNLVFNTYTPAILEEFANHLDNHALFKYSKCPLAIKQIEEFITTLQEELDEYTKKT